MLDICSNLCHTINMTYTRDQLITALLNEHEHLSHDDDDIIPVDQFVPYLNSLSVEQLIDETSTDDVFTLDEFMSVYA